MTSVELFTPTRLEAVGITWLHDPTSDPSTHAVVEQRARLAMRAAMPWLEQLAEYGGLTFHIGPTHVAVAVPSPNGMTLAIVQQVSELMGFDPKASHGLSLPQGAVLQ